MSGDLTLGHWIRERARTTPDRVAIDFLDRETTYRELDERSERLAAAFIAAGVAPGERVATLTGNSPEHVEVFWACAKAGLILLPLNWRLSPHEIAYQLDDAEPDCLLVSPEHADLADQSVAAALVEPMRVELSRSGLDAIAAGDDDVRDRDVSDDARDRDVSDDARDRDVSDDDGLLLIYTSGTTGKPKGALLTHANCFWTNLSLDLTAGLHGDDVVLQILPQFHVGGWNVQALLAWWKGATVVLEPSFEPSRTLELLQSKGITTMMGVPATYLFLAEEEGFDGTDLSSLRQAIVGGAPMPESLLKTWQERGVAISQGYGLTEAAPNVLCLPPEDAGRKLGFAGKPYLHVEVALRDVATGEIVQGAGQGEVLVRGPNVFAGYWRNPEATAAAMLDGWLVTGDVAERDDEGYYRLRDRTKDMFISGGENVYPAEVESVLHDHPDVVEAAVIGVPDERWGEVGLAAVVLRQGSVADTDELLAHCTERLAKYKVPRHVRLLDALPRSAMNKVLKTQLRSDLGTEVSP